MFKRRVASIALAILLHIGAGKAVDAETITLPDALRLAENHPDLVLARADVQAARGRSTQAGTIANNPVLSGGLGPRFGGSQTMLDYEVGLSQTIELGGKRRYRSAAATALLRAAERREEYARQLVALRVRRGFALASAAKRVLATTQQAEEVAAELKRISDERLQRGAGNLLDVNLAAAAVGRERRRRALAEQALTNAEFELASAVGVEAQRRLEPIGELPVFSAPLPPIEVLVKRALENRADLQGLESEQDAAEANVDLADSLAIPNLSIGGNYAHEEGNEQVLATLSIGLPLWNRNRGGRAEARANERKAEVALQYGARELRRQVFAAAANYETARKTLESFDEDAVEKFAEALALAQEAFEKGAISMLELNLLRSEFVDVRLAYLQAVSEEVNARFELQSAIGGELER